MCYTFPILATGRRKCATAQVKITQGSGQLKINTKLNTDYLQNRLVLSDLILRPFQVLEVKEIIETKNFDISIKVSGGGVMGQAQAIQLALAHSICKMQVALRPALKKQKLLTTDARCKERKKYGLKKARKASQFSKR